MPARSTQPIPAHPDVVIETERRVWSGRFPLDVVSFRHRRFDGAMSGSRTWELLRRGQAAALLPYDPVADAVVLIEQFRFPALAAGVDPMLVELPAGLCEDNEDPASTIRREMREEMHLDADRIERIGSFLLTAGGADECCHLYAGRVVSPPADGEGIAGLAGEASENEDIRIRVWAAEDAIQAAFAGCFTNSVTALGLFWLASRRDWLRQQMDGSMTEPLFLEDSTLAVSLATVIASGPEGIVLDRTVFYARGGGQPGDSGVLRWDGGETPVIEAVKGEGGVIRHLAAPEAPLPAVGAVVEAAIDWPRRYALMRMHTAMHLLCSLIKGAAVTGGSVGADKSRLDFDLPSPPPKEQIEAGLNALIAADHPVRMEWVDEAVLDSDPGLVRTMSVQPPRGTGRLRLIRIGVGDTPVDLQPCGGTHVSRTGEIGPIRVQKIENKGKQNRRIIIVPG